MSLKEKEILSPFIMRIIELFKATIMNLLMFYLDILFRYFSSLFRYLLHTKWYSYYLSKSISELHLTSHLYGQEFSYFLNTIFI